MPRDLRRHLLHGAIGLAALLTLWLLSSEPWGLGVFQLIVFMAPGALLGLGAGWMAHVGSQNSWTWAASRRSAIIGAGLLPPLLAFLIALDGNDRPQRLLAGFVRAAWIALALGAVFAAFRTLLSGRQARKQRAALQQS